MSLHDGQFRSDKGSPSRRASFSTPRMYFTLRFDRLDDSSRLAWDY